MADEVGLDSLESIADEPSVDYSTRKRRIVILLLVYSAICGVILCFLSEEHRVLGAIAGESSTITSRELLE